MSKASKKIKVVHVFASNARYRFSGPVIRWRNAINQWCPSEISHFILDATNNELADPRHYLEFSYSDEQRNSTKWERITWTITLLINLFRYHSHYDLLHVHVLWWGGLLIGPLGRILRCPTVYESVLLDSDTPGGITRERLGGLKLRCLKAYRGILAISSALAEDYLAHGFQAGQVHSLMNFVDAGTFRPARSAEEKVQIREKVCIPLDARVILFVGSLIARKGVDILVRAFIQASRDRPGLHLILLGARNRSENPSLDEQYVTSLNAILKESDMEGKVFFPGLVQDRERLAEYYRAADIFAFPSRNEGLGNVVLEAMAASLPVVATQLPVLKQVIVSGENGLLVPVDDVQAVKEAILSLVNDPGWARRMGEKARKHVEREHDFRSWQAKLTALYHSMMGEA